MFDVLIIGGGAAGFYAAIHIAEADRALKVGILERGKEVLGKVKVSGGGRCNVTHAEFDPGELVKNYPRGEKELLGPFHTYCSGDTVSFFQERGIELKIEEDGRMFPTTDSSQTIIDCFLNEADRLGVRILRHSSVTGIEQTTLSNKEKGWKVTSVKSSYEARKLLVATGGNPKIWNLLQKLGHTIVPPVPSLFTFNIKDERINGIPGLSTQAKVEVLAKKATISKITIKLRSQKAEEVLLSDEGPVLITHWGLSGPAILKLSAWGAILMNQYNYRFHIRVNWLPDFNKGAVVSYLMDVKDVEGKKTALRTKVFEIPRRLWANLVRAAGIIEATKWADTTKEQLQALADQLTECEFLVDGKGTFKEEFVTCGGVALNDVQSKTLQHKKIEHLYFAGEVLDIDAITGGYNFQAAWTTAYVAAQSIVST